MAENFNKSREVFSSPGIPESDEVTDAREQKLIEDWLNSENGPNTPGWRECLATTDFLVLKRIFTDIAQRCQIPEGAVNFIEAGRIFSREGGMNTGLYSPEYNVIVLNEPEYIPLVGISPEEALQVRQEAKEDLEKVFGSLEMCRLAVLVHEETHAASRNVCVGWTQRRRGVDPKYKQTGFSRTFNSNEIKSRYASDISRKSVFLALNEGMIEKLSREVLMEYVQMANWPEEKVQGYKKTLKEDTSALPYSLEVSLIEALTKKLAEKNGQTEHIAWEAMINALLHGESFEESEIVELFEETFGNGFLEELADLYSTGFDGASEAILQFKLRYGL